jgi:hypothetical protein
MILPQIITPSHQPIITLPRTSPIRDGFRATWRSPGLVPAEIAWRWAAGGAFWALLVLSFIEYAGSLNVSPLNALLWKLGYPPLTAQAFSDTVAGSGHKLLAIAAVLIPGLAILWTFAASVGRTATLRAIMSERTVRFRTMLALNFFRSTATLAALTGLAGVFAIAMALYSDGPGTVPHAERSTWTLLIGWTLVAYLWSVVNWFLSLAPVVAVEQNCDALAAVSGTVRMFGEQPGKFVRLNAIFGAMHLLAFIIFTGASLFPLMLLAAISGKVVLAFLFLVTMVYYAIVDFLYVARLSAYATLAAADPSLLTSET